jgi:hypothetical protein
MAVRELLLRKDVGEGDHTAEKSKDRIEGKLRARRVHEIGSERMARTPDTLRLRAQSPRRDKEIASSQGCRNCWMITRSRDA